MRERLTPRNPFWALTVILALGAVPALAQAPQPTKEPATELRGSGPLLRPDASNAIRLDVDLVQLNVTVLDPYGRVVTGLDREHFRVFENKVEQEISNFSSEDVPISIAVILDVSGSMSNKFDVARQAALRFMRTANPRDEFLVVSFNERAQLASQFTSNIETLQSQMMLTPSPKGRTALFDAVYLGLAQMRDAQHSRKAVLIISDGGDNHSRYNERDIKSLVQEADVQIYTIGVFDPWAYRSTSEELWGPTLLADLSELTGGRAFAVQNLNDLPDIASKISLELRNQYVVAYRPANHAKDGKWRKLKVKLDLPRGLPDLQAHHRTGYRAALQ